MESNPPLLVHANFYHMDRISRLQVIEVKFCLCYDRITPIKAYNHMNSKINSLQALRGIAAIMVMFFHYRYLLNISYDGLGDRLFIYGGYGVDIFFIISGFVITLSSVNKPTGIRGSIDFVKNRARRLLPAYYVILILTAAALGGFELLKSPEKASNLLSAFLFIPEFANRPPTLINTSELFSIRWTLNYEIYFYIVMAFSMIFHKRWTVLFAWFFIALIVIPVCISGNIPNNASYALTTNAYINLATNPMVFEFLIGVMFGLYYKQIKNLPYNIRLIITAFCIVTIFALYLKYDSFTRADMQMGYVSALLFLALLVNQDFLDRATPKFMVFLGEISYSLYLIHLGLSSIMNNHFPILKNVDGLVKFILYCGISIFLSWLSYRFVENSFLLKKKKILAKA
ncbi:acyltransferase family protein [Citrobacter braakii]|uniref:acyltransferase family protein n=1 Tax=Citrobacter braakii TaxID=57706 RepID=UPI00397DE2CD